MPGREGNWAEDGGRDGGQEMIKFRNVLMDLRWGDIEESKISTESGPSHWKDGVIINRLGGAEGSVILLCSWRTFVIT